MLINAPIVTVHPQRARVTRRGRADLPGGAAELTVGPPDALVDDSVRGGGRGAAGVRVVGVDMVRRDLVDAPDGRVRAAEEALRAAGREIADLDGTDADEAARGEMLQRLARRSELAAGSEPTSRDDLGRVGWVVDIPPGGWCEAGPRCGVEHPRATSVVGRG